MTSEKPASYDITHARPHDGDLIVRPVGALPEQFSVFTRHGEFVDFMKKIKDAGLGIFYSTSIPAAELRLMVPTEDRTREQLQVLATALYESSKYVIAQKVLASSKRPGGLPVTAGSEKRVEDKFVRIRGLVAMVNGNLEVEDFLEMIRNKV